MNAHDILHQRLTTQGLVKNSFKSPHDAVHYLGAVQAQEFSPSKWGMGLRIKGMNNEDITEAFNEGKILRTHVMRPTWHYVSPEDIGWMEMLTGPRVNQLMGYYNRKLELSDKTFEKTNNIISRALKGDNYLTRQELRKIIQEEGITYNVQKLAHIVSRAELDGIICSGPLKGKQFTYALIEERAPNAKTLSREKALEELVVRYFTSHGPATVKDFVWWSGLTTSDVRKGIEMTKNKLKFMELNNHTYYFSPKQKKIIEDSEAVYLLPCYDEYTIGYTSKHALYVPPTVRITALNGFYNAIVKDGLVVGMWRRTLHKDHITIHTRMNIPFTKKENESLHVQVEKYGEFFGTKAKLD
mgnify:CR=1 FL=1